MYDEMLFITQIKAWKRSAAKINKKISTILNIDDEYLSDINLAGVLFAIFFII
jgi:hypothetical protein